MDQPMMGGRCGCYHHKVVPGMITLIAVVLLLKGIGYMPEQTAGVLWPLFLLFAGLTKFFSGMCKCCRIKHM